MDFANFKINLLSCTSYLHPTLVHSARHFLRHSKMSFISSFPLECNRTLRVQSCWNVWNLLSTNLTIISPIWNILSRSARNSLVSVIHCTYIFAASYSASMPRPERTYTSWRTKPINRWHKRGENGVNRGHSLWPQFMESNGQVPWVEEGGTIHAVGTQTRWNP